ncbi:DNA/RNA non-specific endonuclease [Acetobacteraceae bacterium]|nr:DNA/RNA non-specific endonuclease [Acetobacteraceae bacterium]
MKRFLLLVALFPSFAFAESCPALFLNGKEPTTEKPSVTLCQEAYAVGFSKEMKEPIWSAEHLTRKSVMEAQALHGREAFHEDIKISSEYQAMLADYKGSGWARGHMTPSGDMPNKSARMECFALTNIVPQDMKMNSGVWNALEQKTRTEAKKSGDIYVVTGPAYLSDKGVIGYSKLSIPSHIWKAVYNVKQGKSYAVICENQAESQCKREPVSDLEKEIGVKVFS